MYIIIKHLVNSCHKTNSKWFHTGNQDSVVNIQCTSKDVKNNELTS